MARTSTRAPSPTRLEATAWPAGPGRGAGGRQHGQNKHTRPKPHPIGGHRVACGARPRCRRAAAGPGQTTSQRTEQHQRPGTTGVEATAWPAGPGRGAGERRQGQGGPRDRPLRAVRLACGDLAGGPPPTGTHSGPALQGRAPAPGTPAGPQASTRGADGSRAGRRPPAHKAARPKNTHGARNTRGSTSNAGDQAGPQAAPPQRAEGNPYSPRNALIAGISRTACTRPAR